MYSANLQRLLVRCKRGTRLAESYGWFPEASRASYWFGLKVFALL